MKRESLNIIKYLLVYGFLLVAPVTIIAVIEVVSNRLQGVTMSDDELWATPYMTTGLVLGTALNIIVFLWRRWARLSLGRIQHTDVWAVIAMSMILFVGWYYPEDFLVDLFEVPSNISDTEFENMTGGKIGFIDTGLLSPIAEELLCRGAILGALLRMMPRRPAIAIVLQAVIFGAIHMNPSQMVYGTLYGVLLGWLCWRTGSLLPGIVLHVTNNSAVLLLPDAVDNTYASLGIAPKTIILAVSLLILAYVIWWFHRKYPTQEMKTNE